MARALRHFVQGQLWHITHRCHEKSFFLRSSRDRRRYLDWLLEARKRFGLCVLNYVVTCNHVHLLVKDTGRGVIARSMQLAAGRIAQEFNLRNGRKGAFWEERYHATAIEADEHLHRCLVYMDLNMVRAGVVGHPAEWASGGYAEMQRPPEDIALIDVAALTVLCGFSTPADFQAAYCRWVAESLTGDPSRREDCWSSAVAVGHYDFVDKIKRRLRRVARCRETGNVHGTFLARSAEVSCAVRAGHPCRDQENLPNLLDSLVRA